jgi:hypothetical protein
MGEKVAIIDLETLGTLADAVVLSVGMVVVDTEQDYTFDELIFDGFYETMDVKSQALAGREINKDTLAWWGRQGPEAMKVLKPSNYDIHWSSIMPKMQEYLDKHGANKKTLKVYARGSHFDFSILHHLFIRTAGHDQATLPWNYWNIHDSKTVVQTLLDGDIKIKVDGFIAHNALHDAAHEYMKIQTAIYKFQQTLED